MKILGNRILVRKCPVEKKEGFTTVDVQDDFVYKGIIVESCLDAFKVGVKEGDIVLFAKYSPDTHEIDVEGEKMKVVRWDDVLAVL